MFALFGPFVRRDNPPWLSGGEGVGYMGDSTGAVPYSKPPSVIPDPDRESSVFLFMNAGKSKDTGSSIKNVEDDRRGHGDAIHGGRHPSTLRQAQGSGQAPAVPYSSLPLPWRERVGVRYRPGTWFTF